jgi:hypothetical protein
MMFTSDGDRYCSVVEGTLELIGLRDTKHLRMRFRTFVVATDGLDLSFDCSGLLYMRGDSLYGKSTAFLRR